jgi:predicted DCC family thiol-disulfide oxidoreductase YuxK
MSQNIVFFDGVCNLCSSLVQWLIKHDKKGVLLYAPLQGETAKDLLIDEKWDNIDSIVFYIDGKFYSKSNAVLKVFSVLGFPYSMSFLLFFFPRFVRDFVYDWVAKNRYKWFGKKAECWLPDANLLSKFKP